ncbi:M66 family metalloprotease [Aliivibrio fischeri]|uniref:M66 family metalloprotease n=1 Tax=Aliivibrio fischeri TaxID=668 RepID=UPI00084CAE51|nr:M66 family metalloprotease [Aliivibrio fischeri]OED58298.1 carbohydrate-binding protein [Aliivibrio fischeri]
MKKTYIACLISTVLTSGSVFSAQNNTEINYFNQKDLGSDTQGNLLGSVSLAQSLTLPTTNKIPDDRHPHLVSLRKTLVIFEPLANEVELNESITVIAKNAQGETVHQAVMQLPTQQPAIASQLDVDVDTTQPEEFERHLTHYNEISLIANEEGQPAFRELLSKHDTIHVELRDHHWMKHFTLPEGEAFNDKLVTFSSHAGYNSHIQYSTGNDTLSQGKSLTYHNVDGKWYGKGDMDIQKVAYSDKAYTVALPAEVMQPGLTLTFSTNEGQEGLLTDIKLGANTNFIINAVDIGLLTEPRNAFSFAKERELQRQYFQNIQVSKLTVNPYESIHFPEIMLPDGRLLQDYDPSKADGYGSDSHYRVARELVSAGINSANYGVNSSYVRSGTAWNIDNPYHAVQVTVNMSVGKYAGGLINHGMLGSYVGVASVANSTGNEFSHEVGHEFGVGAHYPGGFNGAVHNRSTERNSAWGWDANKNIFIPNFTREANNQSMCAEGGCAEPFAGHMFGKGTMSGGWPLYPEQNAYTLFAPYESSVFQDAMESKANFDLNSPTGYSKWDHETQSMAPWTYRVDNNLGHRVVTLSDTNSLHQFGPEDTKLQELYAEYDFIHFNMDDGRWARDLYLTNDSSFEGKIAVVETWAAWTGYVHLNGTTVSLPTGSKFAYQYTNGEWVEIENDVLNKKIDLVPFKQGVAVTTLVGYYDPENTLPSYIYPALHGAYGSVYEDKFSPSSCQLEVMTREAGVKTYNLHNRRLTTGKMNRFHVNVETALKPYQANVVCNDETLDSIELAAPKAPLKVSIITTESGFAPEIIGADNVVLAQGAEFDPLAGVKATDDYDGDVTASITVDGVVDTNTAGRYTLTYKAYDNAGSESVVTRQIDVHSEKPVFAGVNDLTIDAGTAFDPMSGVSASDAEDGDISSKIQVSGNVDINTAGIYTLTYRVIDSASQTVTATRNITVVAEVENCEDAWTMNGTYVAGDLVAHNGAVWQAGWWTKGEEPGTTGEWGVWKKVSDSGCSVDKPVTPDPEPTPPPSGEHPLYQAGTSYKEGDIVMGKDEQLYQCKPWPNSGWCSNPSYEPAVSAFWQDAWNKL